MSNAIRLCALLLVLGSVVTDGIFAQSTGASSFIPKCGGCHGTTGAATSPVARSIGVKPASDPQYQSRTSDQMYASVRDGKGKMPPFKGRLTDAQIRDAVAYFRQLSTRVPTDSTNQPQPTNPASLPQPTDSASQTYAAPSAPDSASGPKMTNDDVIELVKAGLSEEVIINSVRRASKMDFDLAPTGLIALKKAGVPNPVIAAMQSGSPQPIAAPAQVSGCQNPRSPNNCNFEKAIAAYYGESTFCLNMLGRLSDYYFLTPGTYSQDAQLNNLFIRAGLLSLVSQRVNGNMMERQFALTQLGQRYYRTDTNWSKTGTGFCYGTPAIQIVDFEDPGPNGTNSTVTFKYRIRDVPTWLTGDLAQEFRNTNLVFGVYGDGKGRASLTLMGSGWKVQNIQ